MKLGTFIAALFLLGVKAVSVAGVLGVSTFMFLVVMAGESSDFSLEGSPTEDTFMVTDLIGENIGHKKGLLYVALGYLLWRTCTIFATYRNVNSRNKPVGRSVVPYDISWFDCLTWLRQELVYTIHLFLVLPAEFVTVWLFSRFGLTREVSDKDVIHILLNTSYVLWLREEVEHVGDVWYLHLDGMALPSRRDCYKNEMIVKIDISQSKVILFKFNGNDIKTPKHRMDLLIYVITACVHPVVHSYQNFLYESCKKNLPLKYWRLTALAQYLNEGSWYNPSLPIIGFGCGPPWLKKLLVHNSKRRIPRHKDFHRNLKAQSPFLRFCLLARVTIFEEFNKAGLHKVDKEAYFICSVVHALDHWAMDDACKWVWFDSSPETYGDGYGWLSSMNSMYRAFVVPVHYDFLPNNYLKSHHHETELYAGMYTRMKKVDEALADRVTLSISF